MASTSSDSDTLSGLSTGMLHEIVASQPGAVIYSDFNHKGAIDHSDTERGHRHERTGSILLPLLQENGSTDDEAPEHALMTAADVRPPEQDDLQIEELVLQFDAPEDRKRVRGYRDVSNDSDAQAPVLGEALNETAVPLPIAPDGTRFQLHATTLAGDPRSPDPAGQTPPIPSPEDRTGGEVWMRLRHREGGVDQPEKDDYALFQIAPLLLQSNLAPARRLHVVSRKPNHNFVYDVMEACWDAFGAPGTFTRAFGRPFPVSTPAERSEVVAGNDVVTGNVDDDGGNLDPLLSANRMYLIDGDEYPDPWIQDQMAIGYCSAPSGRTVSVVLHCKRDSPLAEFVRTDMAHPEDKVFVFNGIARPPGTVDSGGVTNVREASDSSKQTDFGGNLVVSPPVREPTDAENTHWAGPPVPGHPPAPHGKLILGDCHNTSRSNQLQEQETGTVHEETRTLLQSQESQPIVPIDTSWLSVGHVDEIMTFVPSPDGPNLAMARPDVMDTLLTETAEIGVEEGRSHFHRGRHKAHIHNLELFVDYKRAERTTPDSPELAAIRNAVGDPGHLLATGYDEVSIETLRQEDGPTNQTIRTRFLGPIQHRICHCTGLSRETDVLPLPVYFHHHSNTQLADVRTPNVVNMQALNTDQGTHLIVPDPCGPRLPRDDAENVVRRVLNMQGQRNTPVQLPQEEKNGNRGFQFWTWPFLDTETLALFFTRDKLDEQGTREFLTSTERAQLIDVIRQEQHFRTLPQTLQDAVHDTENAIVEANPEVADLIDDRGRFADQWHRLLIPEDTVDVVKAYTQSVLERVGCTVHFVDAWFYHSGGGGVHCGTNVLHEPDRTDDAPPWWETYPDLAAADTTYDPHDTAY